MSSEQVVFLCPGQGAQKIGMGKAWYEASSAAKAIFEEADEVLGDSLGNSLSEICFEDPDGTINQTNVSRVIQALAGLKNGPDLECSTQDIIYFTDFSLQFGKIN